MRNVTVYNQEVYKILNRQKVFSKNALFIKGSAIAIEINLAAKIISNDNTSIMGWVFFVLAVVVAPIAFFVYPLSRAKKNYEKDKKINNGQELVNTIDFEKDKIVCHNNMHQTASVRYIDVQEIVLTNKLIILKKDGKELIHLDRNGFINSTDEECLNLLEEKCTKLTKPFRKK